jgi:hypothetical protein
VALPTSSPAGERKARLVLVGASLLACLLLLAGAEAALRMRPPASLATAPALQPFVYSPDYGWRLRSGWRGRTRDGRPVTLNDAGFRGPVWGTATAGRRRVLLLGDSLTFGTGVEDGETFTARLRERAPRFQPLNLGVSGYGTDQELLLLEREGLALEPEVVVLNVCVGNDIFDNASPVYIYDGATPKPFFTAAPGRLDLQQDHVRLAAPARLARHLVEHSVFFDAVLQLAGGSRRAPLDHDDGEHWGPRARTVLERWDEAVSLTRRIVARVEEVCRARGVRLVVLLHPNRRAFQGDESFLEPYRDAPRWLGRDVPVVDLRETYTAAGLTWEDLALDKLGHLTPLGHDRVAEVLADLLGR